MKEYIPASRSERKLLGIKDLFKKKKSLAELEKEKDIILYSLDWFLVMDVINIDQFNEMLIQSLPIIRNFD